MITAITANGKTAQCLVTVYQSRYEITGISMNQSVVNLDKGSKANLSAAVQPGNATDGTGVNWSSANAEIASVANGVVTGNAYGTTTITATAANGMSVSCEVNVVSTDMGAPILLTAESVASNKTEVTWVKAVDAAGYVVYRSTKKSGTYEEVKNIKSNGTTKFTDKKVTCGKTYYYKVKAYTKNGSKKVYGKDSNKIKCKVIPATPTMKNASGSLKKTKVTWKKVSKATGYEVYRSTKESSKGKKIGTVGAKSSFVDTTSKKAGTVYYYRVRAYQVVNGKKVYSELSELKDYQK